MSVRLGVLGAGPMGSAVIRKVVDSGALAGAEIVVHDRHPERVRPLEERLGVRAVEVTGLRQVEFLLVAVKPQAFPAAAAALEDCSPACVISIMAGVQMATIGRRLGCRRLVRALPNLGAIIGRSTTALAASPEATPEDVAFARHLFGAVGVTFEVPETHFDAFTAASGSSLAFVSVIADALADGAVLAGLNRAMALDLAARALVTTGELLLAGRHPVTIRDEVTSPAGTTAAGLLEIESSGLRGALIRAIHAATQRGRSLGQGADT